MNINKAIIVGRLTKDPVVRSTNTGKKVASFSMATSQTWKDKNGQKQEKASFHNIVVWGKLAEIVEKWLTKGQEAYIEGRIETRDYTDKSGNKRYITEIVAENMQMGAKPKNYQDNQSSQATAPAPNPTAPEKEEEIPTINLDEEDEVKIEDVPF